MSIWFAVDTDGGLLISARGKTRDWSRNVVKDLPVQVIIRGVKRKMKVFPLKTDAD